MRIISWISDVENPPGRWSPPRDRSHSVSADRCCLPLCQSAASCGSSPSTRRTRSSAGPPVILNGGETKQTHLNNKIMKNWKVVFLFLYATYLPEMEAVVRCECDQSALPGNKKNPGLFKVKMIQGDFFHWYPPKKLKYGKPRLGESTLT